SFNDDPAHAETSITGKGSENNLFFSNLIREFSPRLNDSAVSARMLNMKIDEYQKDVLAIKNSQIEYLNKFPAKEKLSDSFIKMIKYDIEYRYWSLLFAYPLFRASSNPLSTEVEHLPASVMEEFAKVMLNNDEALISESYRAFVSFYIRYAAVTANNFKKFSDRFSDDDQQVVVAKEKLKGMVFNNWLAQFSINEKDHVAPAMLRSMVNTLLLSDKDMVYYPAVNNFCAQQMAVQEVPKEGELQITMMPASAHLNANAANDDIGMVDMDGKTFLLSAMKGKVVYIDFWASWCGPCRGMMPYSKDLHDKMTPEQKDKIAFLYISIDGDKESWKKAITDMGMVGTQVNSQGNWQSRVCSYFQINSIPRYMIMDKDGAIVNFDAKRPADPGVIEDLMKLASQ
ncbi:MAG: TlpA disulfide reductase family protein, partial [Bacteroidota bacterium]